MGIVSRAENLARLVNDEWDVLIVGGGISGAGVLREATRRGWRAALIEQRDFAWGTSSRSSKLVHGGLRYLKEGQFKLTLHSVQERDRLMDEAPELVEAQSFLFANCTGRKPGRHLFMLGLKIYDRMAKGRHKSEYHDANATRVLAPGIAPANLVGGVTYIDAKTDDARLVMRVLAEAQAEGGLALNYVEAASPIFNEGRVCGLNVVDVETKQTHAIKARCVINATGAWADNLRGALAGKAMIRPLRGSHLVIPFWRLPVAQAISVIHPADGRPVFFYPWEGVTLIGTTDLDHTGDLQIEACITQAEVDYLLAAVVDQFPSLAINADDIVATYAGVRPVIDDGNDDPSSAGRDHVVLDESGMVTLTGGKLATFRLMAQDALRLAAPHIGKVFAIDDEQMFAPAAALNPRWSAAVRHRLAARYGARAAEFSLLHSEESSPVDFDAVPGTTTLWLELAVAAQHESVVHLDDLFLRRTRLGILLPRGGLDYLVRIRKICQPLLNWTDEKWDEELTRYTAIIAKHYAVPRGVPQ